MYLRLVQARFRPDLLAEIKFQYEKKILPALARTGGCLYAGIVQHTVRKDEGISLTLWESEAAAVAYERSGEFAKLVDVLRPYFSDMSDWKLAEDLRLEYSPVAHEPEVRAYVSAVEPDALLHGAGHENLHLRVVSMNVQEGKTELFRSLYREHVLPVLRNVPGCMVVQLAQSAIRGREFISVTVWNNREAARTYEDSGAFERLKHVLKPALSSLSQWSMDAGSSGRIAAATDQDLEIDTYTIIIGRVLTGRPASDQRL